MIKEGFREVLNINPAIEVDIFRHSIKESNPDKIDDRLIQLTPEGVDLAISKYEDDDSNKLAYGSDYKRARLTAGLIMSGSDSKDLEELESKLNNGINIGSRIGTDKSLGMSGNMNTSFGKEIIEHFKAGDFLKFLVEDSDDFPKEQGDKDNFSYSVMAGNIAKVLKKYYKAIDNWGEILKNDPNKYQSSKLRRFIGTHQGMGESFLAKVIEKVKGIKERDEFVNLLNNQGFDYVDGFKTLITQNGGNKNIHISFNKKTSDNNIYSFDSDISEELLDEIIEEGNI